MKPTAAPPWFPYPDHDTLDVVWGKERLTAGDKSSEKLIERADSAIESGPETLRQQRPGPDRPLLRSDQLMIPDKAIRASAQSVSGERE